MTGPSTAEGIGVAGAAVLVVSNEQPGRRMAGPALRAMHLARELAAAGADVRLAVPEPADTDLGVHTVVFGKPRADKFRRFAAGADVVVTQPQRVDVALGLHSGGARVVYDLYVPSFVEYPASLYADELPTRTRTKLVERNHREYATAIECGDGFLVASQRQRDFLLGALGQAGRLRHPPGAHTEAFPRVAVVPFGLPAQRPPEPADHALKGRLVPPDAVVALWAGGVWNWFDPRTVVRGLALARQSDPRLHLVFLAARHPSAAFTGQAAATRALESEEVAGQLAAGAVAFVDDWVPYDERWAFLRDADVAVSAHFDSPETRMSYRTRFLDHLWAGLPTITTEGGVLSEELAAAGAAITVPAGDSDAWADALLTIAGDAERRERMAAAATQVAAGLTWPQVARPLVELLGQIRAGAVGPRRRPNLAKTAAYLAVAVENRLR